MTTTERYNGADTMDSEATGKPSPQAPPSRTLDTTDATRIGIGAIVGGGIFVLAGTAYAHAGPGAILAFALNGALALLTAMSFAEMATAFPESGGAYVFAKRVLSVRAAFGAGWVLWLAYIVAGVLYAQGFAAYGMEFAQALLREAGVGGGLPVWARDPALWATVPLVLYTLSLIRHAGGGGELATWGKVVALVVLVLAAAGAVIWGDGPVQPLRPFLPMGAGGLLSAMGYTFIALQGFDLIAAVAGEVKNPEHAVVHGMLRSLGVGLVIYLPLLLLIALGGVTPGETLHGMAQREPATFMATAAGNLLGPTGYWLVLVAAVLATLSALHANIMAASRVAFRMASDRTLPAVISMRHPERGTPVMALYLSALTMAALLFVLPDAATAGAAASLIFLISFALAHFTALLARRRTRASARASTDDASAATTYRTPFFPLVPVVGGLACLGLCAFQVVHEPRAAVIVLMWLGLGVVLYVALFAERAQALDAAAEVHDTSLLRLRGQEPLVLVPIVNPHSARAMAQVASALTPPKVGRVLMLSVLSRRQEDVGAALAQQQQTLGVAMSACMRLGQRPEALITVATNPWREIYRVAQDRGCERLLIGLSALAEPERVHQLEGLMGRLRCELSVLSTPTGWDLEAVREVLVPVGGRGNHDQVRARLLASLCASGKRHIRFLRVLPADTRPEAVEAARRAMESVAREEAYGHYGVTVVLSDDVVGAASAQASASDLVVLGLQRVGRNRRGFSSLGLEIAARCEVATIMIGGR